MPLSPDEWRRAREVFEEAIECPRDERDRYLDAACADNITLRSEVASLLAAHDRSPNFIERPAFEVAGDLLTSDEGASLAGRVIGPYVVRHEIGRGGMGVVYLADDTRLSRRVALKAIPSEVARESWRREQLQEEARAAAGLSHPNIATVYALDEIENDLYLVSEYVAGPTLRTMIQAGPMPIAQVIEIALQVARALSAAHAQGIVHRDLKPENAVRTAAGVIKVIDFGLARTENLIAASSTADRLGAGTPGYMAPEQVRGEAGDFRVDLFSFGALVYELASGSNPFLTGGTPATTVVRILEADPAPLSATRHEDVSALDRIVATCLSKDPAARYRSTAELVTALERIRADRAADDNRPNRVELAASRGPRWWWQFHQACMSLLYVLLMYPVWRVRVWLVAPWGSMFVLAILGCAATSTTLRLHQWFTLRFYPSELSFERGRLRMWTRICDAGLALMLVAATAYLASDHQAIGALFVTVAISIVLAAFVIEPTTTRAAFGS